ncbi:MAG: PQQ-binding-like beta-propeller repeat protein [Bacteroidota bacterium]
MPPGTEWTAEESVEVSSSEDTGATDEERFFSMRGRSQAGVRQLIAFSRENGMRMWSSDILNLCDPPLAVGRRIYCAGSDLRAFDVESGARLWLLDTDTTFSQVPGAADAERVYAATLTSIVAVDAASGDVVWRRGLSGDGWVRPNIRALTLSDGDLLVSTEGWYNVNGGLASAAIVALDPATGAERWRFEDGGPETRESIGELTAWNDLLLYADANDEVVAVDRTTREVAWRHESELGFLSPRRAPRVVDGVVYVAWGDGLAYAIDARTGARVWRSDTPEDERFSFVSYETCGPVLLGKRLFDIEAFARADGRRLGPVIEDEQIGQIATADGFAYVSTERAVYALDCAAMLD